MTNEIKEDMNKYMKEFKENINKCLNEDNAVYERIIQ
jgi:hypothetical protein